MQACTVHLRNRTPKAARGSGALMGNTRDVCGYRVSLMSEIILESVRGNLSQREGDRAI